jgi:ankyrin repeat protein
MRAVRLCSISFFIPAFIPAIWAAGPPVAAVTAAATRAVARLQESQKNWFSQQSCNSCHHQLLPALAYQAAREHGIRIDEKIARADAIQAFSSFRDLDRALQHSHVVDPGIGDAYNLLAADAAGVRPSVVTAVYARLLAQRQKPDGHWITFDERPPQSYSVFTSTALAARAIDLYAHPSLRADTDERIERARAWLASHSPHDTEERAFQLLGLWWTGADRAALREHARELLLQQQADGGWNSLGGRLSEAYSTGEALVALHDAGGFPVSDSAWKRGIEFLVKSQAQDGSWHVTSRLYPPAPLSPDYFESGYPYGHDQFLSAMGGSWAVMALARALGPAHASTRRPELREAAPSSVEPWAETILFGGAGDVRRLLDGGFDPNSATRTDGTTALMMAAPSVEKMKLLLDSGAKINARTKNGYSALLMSALYSDSAPAIRLLLDLGAEMRPPKGEKAPLFNAFPLALAAIAGNAEAVTLLHAAGDAVDDDYVYAGLQPASPLVLISTMDETAVARALIDAGAAVDKADPDGLTALLWATLANKTEMAKLLIEHGADVNYADKHGMTPLLYAASIDFGDSSMIDLLLKSHARTDARTPEGLTALDLARKYKHTHLIESLDARKALLK